MMYNQIAIETALREREREVEEEVRRRRLLAGEGADPDPALAAVNARAVRRERRIHPVRLTTP